MGKDHTKYYNYIIEDVDEKTIFHTAISTFTVVIIFIPIGLITKFLLSLFFGSIL